MKMTVLLLMAAGVGLACGAASATILAATQAANLILWAVAGLLLGLLTVGWRERVWAGLVYGVALTASFLLIGFQGTAENVTPFLVLTLGLCIPGALAGVGVVFAGSWVRRVVKRIVR